MPRPFSVNEIPSGIASNRYPLTLSPTEMIGFTAPPGVSGVSIAGTEVWNPELLSAPAGSAAGGRHRRNEGGEDEQPLSHHSPPFASRLRRRV